MRKTERGRGSYFKESSHPIAGVGKSEICTASQWTVNSDNSWYYSLESKFHWAEGFWPFKHISMLQSWEFFLFWEISVFVLKAFNRLNEVHPPGLWRIIWFIWATDLNVNQIQGRLGGSVGWAARPWSQGSGIGPHMAPVSVRSLLQDSFSPSALPPPLSNK